MTMAEIKSALELALEKAERYGKASPQEMQELKWQEQARHLAGEFLREKINLEPELQKLPSDALPSLTKYLKEILLRNINLPREGVIDDANKRAQVGLLQVIPDKKATQRVLQEINQIFASYAQVRQNALQQFKSQFNAQLDSVRKSLEAQMQRPLNVDVENTPQFQEQWQAFEAQLNQQFEPLLDKHKAMLTTL
jgi:hypothetical protein